MEFIGLVLYICKFALDGILGIGLAVFIIGVVCNILSKVLK